jgi:tetratricopeptide (TPR) repeat protein
MLGLAAAFGSGVFLMTLKISSYAQVKAFYALPVLLVLCAFAGMGWAFVARQSRWLARIIATGLLAWSMLVGCTFWIRSWSPQTQTAKGMQAVSADRFAEAEERLSRVLRSNNDYWPARVGLVNVLRESGRLEAAQKEAETLVAQGQDNPEGYFQLGLVLQASGQEEKAVEQFERVKTMAPAHLGAYQHLALSLSNLKRYQEAVTVYKEGLGVYPLSFELLNNLAWLRATCADAATRNGTEAVFLAETACQLTSYERPVLIGTLAAAYAQAGRFEDAVNAAERARRLASAMGQDNVAKKNAELEELYRAGSAYVEGR